MEFRILGPLEVRRDRRAVAVPGGKPRAVLAVLLLHANEPVNAERLAVALWGEDAPAGAIRTVQVYLSRLRRALGENERLTTSRAGYRLRVRAGELDRERFERLVEDGRRALAEGRAEQAGRLLREALALWRGPPLADLAFEPFAPAEIVHLEEQRLAAVEARVEADLAAARHAELVPELQRLIDEHPLRESLRGQLMLALYRSGRQADALEAYRRTREVLVEQLGIEPSAELRALEQAMLMHDPALSVDAPAGVEPGGAAKGGGRRTRIPHPPTATIGRDADLERLRAVVCDPAVGLVTVVGPPGVGKTRLAIEAAWAVASQLRDGAVFVSLAALDGFEHVGSTIARELEVNPGPGESVRDAVIRHLGGRELLLVLDNFEHVLDAAPLVAELLTAAPELTVVATSREPLRVRAERLVRVDPLAVPAQTDTDWSIERARGAVELFVAVARARDPGFTVGRHNWSAVVESCRRLDGLPLAIELAAGRVGLLSVPDLLAGLRSGLDALGAGPRDAPSRQRTLAATLEWSYGLLAATEQRAFLALAVFAGGCTLDAAQAVTGTPLEALEALVAKNLLLVDRRPDRSARLGMLETVRAFARARLAQSPDADAVHRRHCEHYLARAAQARSELERSGSPALLADLDAELDNCRAALRWSSDNAPVLALRLASALTPYWYLRALKPEAAGWLNAALSRDVEGVPRSVRADALAALALNLVERGGASEAEVAVRESLELRRSEGDLGGCARSTSILSVVHRQANRTDEAYRCALEAERLALEAGDDQALVWARGEIAMTARTVTEALRVGELVAAAYRAAGNDRGFASLQTSLAYGALAHGDHATAQRLSLEALDAAGELGDPYLLALAHGNAGLTALFTAEPDRAERAFAEELRLMGRRGYDNLLFEALNGLAAAAASQGRDRIAATLSGAADATSTMRHHPGVAGYMEERLFTPARIRIGEPSWQAAYADGATLDRDEAIETALQTVRLRVVA